jgi:cation-transporting ATPase F
MITGDHAITARAMALKRSVIADEGADGVQVITGRELEEIADEDLPDLAMATDVFARVAPEQKLRLVRALQVAGTDRRDDGRWGERRARPETIRHRHRHGHHRHGRGQRGGRYDPHGRPFATIAAAVEEGRGVFDNLRKFIVWTLPTNASVKAASFSWRFCSGSPCPSFPCSSSG